MRRRLLGDEKSAHLYFKQGIFYQEKARGIKTEKNHEKAKKKWKSLEKAINYFTKAIEIDPNNAEFYYYRGLAYRRQFKFKKSIADYTQAISINPNDIDFYIKRGFVYKKMRTKFKASKAIADFTQAISMNPNDAKIYCHRGDAHIIHGKPDIIAAQNAAIDDYTLAIQQDPNNQTYYVKCEDVYKEQYKYYVKRGDIYKEQEQYHAAIIDYNLAIKINPNKKDAYIYRGLAYEKLGELNKAIESYKEALNINPKGMFTDLEEAYQCQKKLRNEIDEYTQYLKKDAYASVYAKRGNTYLALGELDEAIADFNEAIDIDPDNAVYYYYRSLAYQKKGRLNEATIDLDMAFELRPVNQFICKDHEKLQKIFDYLKSLSEIDNEQDRIELAKHEQFGLSSAMFEAILKQAAKLNELMKQHSLTFNEAEHYLKMGASSWLLQRIIPLNKDKELPFELYMTITSFLIPILNISQKEIERLLNVLNDRIYAGAKMITEDKFQQKFFSSRKKYDQRQQQIQEHYESRKITY